MGLSSKVLYKVILSPMSFKDFGTFDINFNIEGFKKGYSFHTCKVPAKFCNAVVNRILRSTHAQLIQRLIHRMARKADLHQ